MTRTGTLRAATHDVADAFEANELYQERGWTDGLPIVPPTADRVARFLEAGGWMRRTSLAWSGCGRGR